MPTLSSLSVNGRYFAHPPSLLIGPWLKPEKTLMWSIYLARQLPQYRSLGHFTRVQLVAVIAGDRVQLPKKFRRVNLKQGNQTSS